MSLLLPPHLGKNVDAHRILPGLWQGRRPPKGHRIGALGFDVLVLAAEEYQPPSGAFPGVDRVVHAPLDDHPRPLSPHEWKTILDAANTVSRRVKRGQKCLVTCNMGINRSGIITALCVCLLTGVDGKAAVKLVRSRRPGALMNTSFASQLESVMR